MKIITLISLIAIYLLIPSKPNEESNKEWMIYCI